MEFLFYLGSITCFTLSIFVYYRVVKGYGSEKRRLITEKSGAGSEAQEEEYASFWMHKPFRKAYQYNKGSVPFIHKIASYFRKRQQKHIHLAGFTISFGRYSTVILFLLTGMVLLSAALILCLDIPVLPAVIILMAAVFAAVVIPECYIRHLARKRINRIRMQLPSVLNMLAADLESGLTLEDALSHVVQQANNELSQEFALLYEQLQSGRPRKDAFKDLFERSSVLELKLFAMAMIQAEQYRISVSETLKAQASKLQDEVKDLLDEETEAENMNLVTPIILFVSPLVFIVLFVFSITNLI